MLIPTIFLAACFAGQAKIEPPHDQNPVFTKVVNEGIEAGGQTVRLAAPRLVDGQTADVQRAALKEVAGSDRALDELLRDSVTAPFIIKVRDLKTTDATIRQADIWFAVHGGLKKVDPAREAARTDQKAVEVANMWFQTRLLKADEFRAGGIKLADTGSNGKSWYAHIHAKLLDRIDFEVTNHVVASESSESVVIASATDPSFDNVESLSNGWKSLAPPGSSQADAATRHPYSGGISYAKISRIAFKPGALFVEMHVAFVEPVGWFQGAPILRSKFSVAAQDQIRSLRRELAKQRSK
jgi:hypothetical protein